MALDLSAHRMSAYEPGQEIVGCDDGVDPVLAKLAGEAAFRRVMEFQANNDLVRRDDDGFDDDGTNDALTRIDWSDVIVEGMLGVGGFACVCKVSVPVLEFEEKDGGNPEDDACSSNTGTSSSSASTGLYALKCLNQRTTMDKTLFVDGAADLASEALLLNRLRGHDNIVRLYGVYNGCVSTAFQENGGYFLLEELLRGTVSDLLRLWADDLKNPSKAAKIPSALERVQGIALGIGRGMEHIHKNNIVYRDLKPSNCGFDREGRVRLFDFGLARQIVTDSTTTDVSIPGVAGSFRYMANEVCLGKGSTFASDVYSFGMVLWSILTLEKPHANIDGPMQEFQELVAIRGQRPSVKTISTFELTELLRKCWDADPTVRPGFTEVCKILEMEISNHGDALAAPILKTPSWRQQLKYMKKSMQHHIRDRRRLST